MVFFYISKHVTKWIGPPLFRTGLRLRNRLTQTTNNYWMDMACMLPYSQKILSLAIYDESKRRANEFRQQYQQQQQEQQQQQQQQQQQSEHEPSSNHNNKATETATETATMMADPSAIRRISETRIEVLDEYLRPSLVPNHRWSDIEQSWRYNLRIVAWARKEFLIGKYGPYIQEALVAYPRLRNSPQISSSFSSSRSGGGANTSRTQTSPFLQLPPSDTILNAFRMKRWSNDKNTERIGTSLLPIAEHLGGTIVRQPSSSRDGSSETEIETIATKHVDVPLETDVGSVALEDILEVVTRGYLKQCGPLNALCQEANFYQLYSREYVQHLGDYLLQRTAPARRLAANANTNANDSSHQDVLGERPFASPNTVVLDIGAGDGILMHCLRDYMERKVMGLPQRERERKRKRKRKREPMVIPIMVATDDMSWRIFAKAEVEKLSVDEALKKYACATTESTSMDGDRDAPSLDSHSHDPDRTRPPPQVIVICSWMPMGVDWTALFREAGVEEYILIGEADDGSCGDNWSTWGNPAFWGDNSNSGGATMTNEHEHEHEPNDDSDSDSDPASFHTPIQTPTPSYAVDGYQRFDMDAITRYQFSSFDLATSKSSKTVSFRK
eukprot:jgi/Psemu1/154136/gw1.125.95.1